MVTKFEYAKGRLDQENTTKNPTVSVSLKFQFAVSGEKLEAREYEELAKIAGALKRLRDDVAKRVEG